MLTIKGSSSKIILRRLDPRRYRISTALAEFQRSISDFLLLVSVAVEFNFGLSASTLLRFLHSNLQLRWDIFVQRRDEVAMGINFHLS